MQRVVIVGCSGAGKSTLSVALGQKTGLPVVHLDAHYWRAGWKEPSDDEWDDQLGGLLKADRWIMDGNYGRTAGMRLEKADTLVFLDFPRSLCLARVFLRVAKYCGRTRPDLGADCPEHFPEWEFLRFIWNYDKKSRLTMLRLVDGAKAAGKTVVILRRPRDVSRFLSSVTPVGG